jgi:hypothetical protein
MFITFVAAVAMTSIAAGCGGGNDQGTGSAASTGATSSPTSSKATLTKAEFIKQADAICEKTDKVQEAGLKAYLQKKPEAQSTKAGQSKMVLAVGLPPIQTEAEELAELGAPSGDEAKVAAIVDGIEKAVEKGEAEPGSLLTGSSPFTEVDKLAGEYGFKACNNAL